MTVAAPPRPAVRPAVLAPAVLLAAGVAGLLLGAGTSWLQGELSGGWYLLADSGAVWTVLAFCVAVLCGGPRWLTVTAGAMTLVCEVAGYYVLTAHARGFAVTVHEQVIWTIAALWIGPAAGLAAHAARRGAPGHALAGLCALAGVVAGEAAHILWRVGYAVPGRVELLVGCGVAAVALVAIRASWPARGRAVLLGGAVAAATYAVYGVALT